MPEASRPRMPTRDTECKARDVETLFPCVHLPTKYQAGCYLKEAMVTVGYGTIFPTALFSDLPIMCHSQKAASNIGVLLYHTVSFFSTDFILNIHIEVITTNLSTH